jgi:hypothetical protein
MNGRKVHGNCLSCIAAIKPIVLKAEGWFNWIRACPMIKLSWCHGIGNHATVQGLLVLLRTHGLRLVFLSVTIKKSEHVWRLQNCIGLCGFGGVDSDGLSGGLDLFCHESIHVDVKELNERLLICMFGWLRVNQHGELWSRVVSPMC